MSKYDPLQQHLEALTSTEITLTFQEIERIIGANMEPSARTYLRSWDNTGGSSAVRQNSWLDAGWKTVMVDLENEKVKFHRRYRTAVGCW